MVVLDRFIRLSASLVVLFGVFGVMIGCRQKTESDSTADPRATTSDAAPEIAAIPVATKPDFLAAIKSTSPLAYYRLEAVNGDSEVGDSSYQSMGGVSQAAVTPISGTRNKCALFDGKSGWIATTQAGGIADAGSIMAWVNLSEMPRQVGHIQYIAGESTNGNDFDLQFEPDNKLKFYTDSGSHSEYAPNSALLVGQWHMIIVTMDRTSRNRTIYWDGFAVAIDHPANLPNKTGPFTIGDSSVWQGRFFAGAIDEVAYWNRALSAPEVLSIYNAAKMSRSTLR